MNFQLTKQTQTYIADLSRDRKPHVSTIPCTHFNNFSQPTFKTDNSFSQDLGLQPQIQQKDTSIISVVPRKRYIQEDSFKHQKIMQRKSVPFQITMNPILITCIQQENALLRKQLQQLKSLSNQKDGLISTLRTLVTKQQSYKKDESISPLNQFRPNNSLNISLKSKPSAEEQSMTLRTIRNSKQNSYIGQ